MRRTVLAALVWLVLGALASAWAAYDEEVFFKKTIASYTIPTPPAAGPAPQTVVGQIRTYRIRRGDTLMDLARLFDLGYNEILEANPGLDPWVPPVGATILVPTEWVLPCCTYEGVVVNIPEMRLYFYRRAGDTTTVYTYPVGLGRDEWRTPSGKFRVRGKTLNPQWNIPESIRKEHIAERGDARTFIAGGDPENPLGRHRIELTLPMYAIHGTNIPWGVGMQVSHGCVRLYPEDVERLFPLIPVGTPGEFAYQTVKVGTRDGVVYVEAHRDIYGHSPALFREATEAAQRAGRAGDVDQNLLLRALDDGGGGMPTPVSSASSREAVRDGAAHPDERQAGDG